MAKEILSIPEDKLDEVVQVILLGIRVVRDESIDDVSDDVIKNLEDWCSDIEEYLKRLRNG